MLAAQGVLAALLARSRGHPIARVETLVLQAALLEISQYLARASCNDAWGEWGPALGTGAGPPFRTADGHWFELEARSPEAWRSFWSALGLDHATLARGWRCFLPRYSTAACSMPDGFHDATARVPLADLLGVGEASGVSLCRLRSYDEVLADVGIEVAAAHPRLHAHGCTPSERATADRQAATSQAVPRPVIPPSTGEPSGPLADLHVVEATSRVQGPLAGQLLRMLGARVTRVEPPGGDPARMTSPLAGDTGAFFACMNRGKEPVQLDLSVPAGRAGLRELVAEADVFLHNWRPDKASEWELEAEDLTGLNPSLVHCGASGWGGLPNSPAAMGMEYLVQAHAGLGQGLNPEGEPPFPSRLLLADVAGGMVACEGILAGLWRRERSGRGSRVDTSLWAGALTLQSHVLEALARGEEPGRSEGRPLWGSLDHALPTADGYLVVSVDDDALPRLALAVGVTAAEDRSPAVEEAIARALRSRPAAEWEAALHAADVTCAVATADLRALTSDARLQALFELLGGTSRAPTTPWRFER